jgi:hypothetical protein
MSPPFTIYLPLTDADLTTQADNFAFVKIMQEKVAIKRAKKPEI